MKRSLLFSLLALLALVGPARAEQDVIATLTAYDGTLDVVRTGIALSLYPDMPLLSGDVVHTRDGRATVRFTDSSEVRVRANTRLAINERKERRDIDVFFGRLWAYVARQKDQQTSFRTGGTIAAVRGTRIEYAALIGGKVDIGVIEGLLELFFLKPDGRTASTLLGAGNRMVIDIDGTVRTMTFAEGDIVSDRPAGPAGGAGPAAAAAAPPPTAPPPTAPPPAAPTPRPESARTPAPASTPAPAKAAPVAAAPAAAASDEAEEERPATQGEYALRLVNALGIAQYLAPNSTARDAMDYLARLNLLPCSGQWDEEKAIDLNDLLCIAGIDPNDPNAPLTISQEELIAKILEKYGELFWLQARRKQTVSPFAP